MNAMSAPKFSNSAPSGYVSKKAPKRVATPTRMMLLLGTRVCGFTAAKTPGAQMRARAGADGGDQQRQIDRVKEPLAAGFARHVTERRVHVGKAPARPNQLCGIDL